MIDTSCVKTDTRGTKVDTFGIYDGYIQHYKRYMLCKEFLYAVVSDGETGLSKYRVRLKK